MKMLHKLLAVLVLGAMVAPAVEAGRSNGGKPKTGQCAKRKPLTQEQKDARNAKARERRAKNKAATQQAAS
jgi:hypothetical protein